MLFHQKFYSKSVQKLHSARFFFCNSAHVYCVDVIVAYSFAPHMPNEEFTMHGNASIRIEMSPMYALCSRLHRIVHDDITINEMFYVQHYLRGRQCIYTASKHNV